MLNSHEIQILVFSNVTNEFVRILAWLPSTEHPGTKSYERSGIASLRGTNTVGSGTRVLEPNGVRAKTQFFFARTPLEASEGRLLI